MSGKELNNLITRFENVASTLLAKEEENLGSCSHILFYGQKEVANSCLNRGFLAL